MTNLIQRCQAGEAEALEYLVKTHHETVFRLAVSILDDPAEAEDAVQDAFISALRSLSSYQGDAAPGTWLYRITVNTCLDRLRRRRAVARLQHALHSLFRLQGQVSARPEETTIQHEADEALRKAVDALGDKHRLPVILFYYHNLSVAEIAAVLDMPEGTVLSRLHTARERLRYALVESPFENLLESSKEGANE